MVKPRCEPLVTRQRARLEELGLAAGLPIFRYGTLALLGVRGAEPQILRGGKAAFTC